MKQIIVAILALSLSACATKTVTEYVTKYELVIPSEAMLNNCKITSTFEDKEKYSLSNYILKEKTLYTFSNSLLGDIAICNSQWEELRKWYIGQEIIYKEIK